MNTSTTTSAEMVKLTIDGRPVIVPSGTSVFDAARVNGIVIPTLCHLQNENPVGVCRLCVVEIKGLNKLLPACVTTIEEVMMVTTADKE